MAGLFATTLRKLPRFKGLSLVQRVRINETNVRIFHCLQTLTLAAIFAAPAPAHADIPAAAVFNGAVDGTVLVPKAAYFNTYTDTMGNQGQIYVITDQNDFCTQVTQKTAVAKSNTLVILVVHGSNTAFPDTGDYVMGAVQTGALTGQASFFALDGNCAMQIDPSHGQSVSGEVTTSYVTASAGLGAYTLRIGSQNDLVSGSFHAAACAALDLSVLSGTWSTTCR